MAEAQPSFRNSAAGPAKTGSLARAFSPNGQGRRRDEVRDAA
jgi:hypothetical protein